MKPQLSVLPAAALLINASVWGLSWLPLKILFQLGLHPLWTVVAMFSGALTLLVIARPTSLLNMLQHPRLWLLALAAGMTNLGFTWAIAIGDVVRVTLLFYLMPVWSIGLAWLLLGEQPSRSAFLRLILALAGVILVLWQPDTTIPLPQDLPDYLALMGGFFFALNNVLLRRWSHLPEEGRAVAMFVGGVSTAAIFAFAGAATALPTLHLGLLPWILGLSLAYLIGNLALQYGAARLPANVTALIMLAEVAIATISSIMLGAANPTLMVWVGGSLIMLAALLAINNRGMATHKMEQDFQKT